MGFPAQLTESTNHKHAQRYVSWVILAPAKVTTNVNHHRQSLVLHNYSPDYLCSHGEGVCGNIYLLVHPKYNLNAQRLSTLDSVLSYYYTPLQED